MNYRHSFHAGGVADVFKHYVLTLILAALRQKETSFCAIDTHAGCGLYELATPGECEQGIGRLWQMRAEWPALHDYFKVIETVNTEGNLCHYPGSPLIIAKLLRDQDRGKLLELHADEYQVLKASLANKQNMAVHHGNAWQLLKAFMPPKENRGVILIDPPYEDSADFEQARLAIKYGEKHWRNGIYMVWYPIKHEVMVARWRRECHSPQRDAVAVEFTTLPTDVGQRLNGSGLIIVNPPWKLMDTLRQTLPPLAQCLAGANVRGEVKFINLA